MHHRITGNNKTCIHFGSQSEGTTTPGLQSDIDTLVTKNDVNIMYTMDDWKQGSINYLMVRDVTTAAQHYMLQAIGSDLPLPVIYTDDPYHETDSQGRVLLSNLCVVNEFGLIFSNIGLPHIRSGPSNSPFDDMDNVEAFVCKTLPPEILSWFNHDRHGYWPPTDVFEAARHCPCYLVPDGHHASVNKHLEWRITPNLIERILMFSTNLVQRKCLVVLKMLKKEILATVIPASHVRCKLTTFHCKTALFFTLEKTPPSVWKKQCLVECIVRCLQTIREFLFQGECPHYIVENVDLFDGKLCRGCQVRLEVEIRQMIQDDMRVLFQLQCDGLGQLLQQPTREVHDISVEITNTNDKLCTLLATQMFGRQKVVEIMRILNITETNEIENRIRTLTEMYYNEATTRYERRYIVSLATLHRSMLASLISAKCIQMGQPISLNAWQLYSSSIDTDVASARLKLASMLYCRGDLQRAEYVLDDVERRLDDSVLHVCGWREDDADPSPRVFSYTSQHGDPLTLSKKICYCVRFMRPERFCAPAVLWLEMARVNDHELNRQNMFYLWMKFNAAEVDAKPFQLYLQYLTYRGLGARCLQRKEEALVRLITYTLNNIDCIFHQETVCNLVGHCFEIEGNVQWAAFHYNASLIVDPINNAANWHLQRLARNLNN